MAYGGLGALILAHNKFFWVWLPDYNDSWFPDYGKSKMIFFQKITICIMRTHILVWKFFSNCDGKYLMYFKLIKFFNWTNWNSYLKHENLEVLDTTKGDREAITF